MASAKNFLEKKDTKSAVIQLKSALQQQPDLAEARFLLGRALLDTGEAVLAEVELRKALDYKYPEATVVPVLAQALLAQGKGQRVIAEYATTQLAERFGAVSMTLEMPFKDNANLPDPNVGWSAGRSKRLGAASGMHRVNV